jgi:hypothetical protein
MNHEVMRDWTWANGYLGEVERVLKGLAHQIITISVATEKEDTKYATDYRIIVEAGSVACRVRRPGCHYRDLTIRHSRPSGVDTEEQKILAGHCKWYLYAWALDNKRFAEWIFVDLDQIRESNVICDAPIRRTPQGQQFRTISIDTLSNNGCLIEHKVPWKAA